MYISYFLQSGDDHPIVYSTPNSEWDVLETFEAGSTIDIDVIFTNYHWVSRINAWILLNW